MMRNMFEERMNMGFRKKARLARALEAAQKAAQKKKKAEQESEEE